MSMLRNVLTVILAGGKGTRLEPLTRDRAKPAVPFGGIYRIIDFTLSNCVNSGLRRIQVLTQFKSRSLDRHLRQGWNFLPPELHEGVEILPPQQRIDENWYKGTADALYQNIYSLEKMDSEYTVVLAGDHIYKMDYGEMVRSHISNEADITIGCIPVPVEDCRQFGIVEIEQDGRIVSFLEKPLTATPMPELPGHVMGSMGIYVFNTRVLFERLCADAASPESHRDFGKNIIPAMIDDKCRVFAHQFRDLNGKSRPYWRDVGTLDSYYQTNMDLVSVEPELNLYDSYWPMHTYMLQAPPPKFIHAADGMPGHSRRGEALQSIVSQGCIISGGQVHRSVLSPRVRVNSYAVVESSILFEGVQVGRHCRIRKAIIDKEVKLPSHTVIGFDHEFDRRRGFTITDSGVVIVAKSEPAETFQAPNPLPY